MHIGFDGLFLEQPATGSGQYARALLGQLAQRSDLRVTVLRPEPPATQAPAPGPSVPAIGGAPPGPLRAPRLRKVWWEQVGLPQAAVRAGVDLIHVPYFSAPIVPRRPLVVTVHDVIPLVLPLYAGSAAMRLYLAVVRRTVRRAAAVVTDSEAARSDILRVLSLPAERVTTIHLAADARYRPLPAAVTDPVLARLGVRPPYILNTGGFDARKNLLFLISAVARATADQPDWQLVLTSRPHSDSSALYPDPRPLLAELGLTERTIFTGLVSEDDKAALYSRAGLCVLPTLYEGFGLPALEAMACGAPVLAADRTSLPEVVGDGGVLADPTNLDSFSATLAALLRDPERRSVLGRAGLVRAGRFSWATTADQTVAIYRRALGRADEGPIGRATVPADGRDRQ